MKVAVIFCGHCGAPRVERYPPVAGNDGTVNLLWIRDLCSNPDQLVEIVVKGAEYLIVMGPAGIEIQGALMEAATGSGIFPLNLDFLSLPSPTTSEAATALILSALAAVRDFRRGNERHVKPTNRVRGFVTRRSFLRGMKPAYFVSAPSVDATRCAANRGCNLCAVACPAGALVPHDGSMVLRVGDCTACNRCLAACPTGALVNPATAFERLRRRAEAWADAGPAGPYRLVLACWPSMIDAAEWLDDSLGPTGFFLETPCLGMIKPQEYVELLTLGFSEIVCVRDQKACENVHRCSWGIPTCLPGILKAAGLSDRIRQIDPTRAPMTLSQVIPSPKLPKDAKSFQSLHVAAAWLLGRDSGKIPVQGRGAGVVNIDPSQCTLCLLCANRCPTAALRSLGEGTEVRLTFRHELCDACGLCESVCPERALSLAYEIRVDELGTETSLVADSWVLCRNCGVQLAPLRMIEKVRGIVSIPRDRFDLCPDCKPLTDVSMPTAMADR